MSSSRDLLKLKLRGSTCDNCHFKLTRNLVEGKDWCYSHEQRPPQNICILWGPKSTEDELLETTDKLLRSRRKNSIKVKVKKPTKAEIKEWFDWSILERANH